MTVRPEWSEVAPLARSSLPAQEKEELERLRRAGCWGCGDLKDPFLVATHPRASSVAVEAAIQLAVRLSRPSASRSRLAPPPLFRRIFSVDPLLHSGLVGGGGFRQAELAVMSSDLVWVTARRFRMKGSEASVLLSLACILTSCRVFVLCGQDALEHSRAGGGPARDCVDSRNDSERLMAGVFLGGLSLLSGGGSHRDWQDLCLAVLGGASRPGVPSLRAGCEKLQWRSPEAGRGRCGSVKEPPRTMPGSGVETAGRPPPKGSERKWRSCSSLGRTWDDTSSGSSSNPYSILSWPSSGPDRLVSLSSSSEEDLTRGAEVDSRFFLARAARRWGRLEVQ
ncbi:hypothetical protein E2C01_053592 [Portunus trituberculatus]|uniref:Uncharacterized protein n=1 Tax=Portunus trituberculatus TaxID=210409 RepID=A0A5B7GPM2_PORTR|nr:hypothetical protein [Portunus trituberculatus]